MVKRCMISFAISAMCGLAVNLLLELIMVHIVGLEGFTPISPAYLEMFSSERIAVEINILLYGIIGAGFSAMTFIYECSKIGFVLQNLIYCLLTCFIWVPIVTLLWQLQRYPNALTGTLTGFAGTYVIMSIVGYKTTKKDVEQINATLQRQKEEEVI